MTRDKAKEEIIRLVERFRENLDVYKKGTYNETQLRREFVDPFFEALGWDVTNKSGHAEQYKDVVHEDAVRIGATTKAPDYSFRVGGQRKFFLETKKPSINIKDDVSPAYQIRRYAWNANLPISILTDFEELAVYDCGIKPNPNDKVSMGRVAFYHFEDYVKKFDEIYDTFSKEAVWKGAFDRYASEGKKGKKGTETVDKEFLKEIERWRELLAKNIAVNNSNLDVYALNFSVQQTIDRIVFLRICEDRGMENYGQLQALLNGANVYKRLFDVFYKADQKYNSGLFDFSVDKLTHSLSIDDKVLKDIIENLYYPRSPYEFAVFDAEILGNVYEQFLGKVIRLTPGHQAKVEEKPEVKKAGGVYYTPKYIVDYIVANTVGKLLGDVGQGFSPAKSKLTPAPVIASEAKQSHSLTPKQVEKIKILDPACGSGSFLLGAYRYLLDWHLKWYIENDPIEHAKGKRPAIYKAGQDSWRLTTQEKKKILLNNIFGVDIDRQAVEVTKLSLLLKVLEGENEETLGKSLALFRERALPNLESNIKCGNSLIGPDFYSQMTLGLPDEEARRINVFDWNDDKKGFGKIMKDGGFDCVIGNPPYVRQEMIGEFKPYFESRYTVYHGMADLYVYFIEKAVSLLKEDGLFSYIVANKWMRANYGEPLRRWMKKQAIEEITDFGDLPVFQNATTYPCILRIRKGKPAKALFTARMSTLDFQDMQEYVNEHKYKVSRLSLDDKGWSLSGAAEEALLAKIKSIGVPLGDYVNEKIYRGIVTGLNEAFVIDEEIRKRLIKEDPKSKEIIKPLLIGRDIKRYQTPATDKYMIFTCRGIDIKKYPTIEKYLSGFKERLLPKPKDWKGKEWKGRKSGSYKWYEIQDAIDYYGEFEKPKLIWGNLAIHPQFTFDTDNRYINAPANIIQSDDLYLLAILNSPICEWQIKLNAAGRSGGFYEYKPMYVSQLPIHPINFKDKTDKALHDKMVSLVDAMLELNKKLKDTKTPHDSELIERRIKATDSEIDRLVYELYGLTEEEIKVVEGEG